jgi:glycine/D-amino acid oxidase-like deaminating enzyme
MPFVDPTVILGAFWVPGDGVAKAVRANEAMIRQAGDAVELLSRTPVVAIETADGRVAGVRTPHGTVATDKVLVCAGIWGPTVARWPAFHPAGPGRAPVPLDGAVAAFAGESARSPGRSCATRTATSTCGTGGTLCGRLLTRSTEAG